MLLRVVPDVDLVAERELTEVGLRLAGQDAQQAGLAGTVQAQHQHALAAAEVERDVLEHRRTAVRLGQAVGAG